MAIQFLRGTASQISSSTTVPEVGQPVYATDSNQLYIGDGTTQLKSLNPVSYDVVDLGTTTVDNLTSLTLTTAQQLQLKNPNVVIRLVLSDYKWYNGPMMFYPNRVLSPFHYWIATWPWSGTSNSIATPNFLELSWSESAPSKISLAKYNFKTDGNLYQHNIKMYGTVNGSTPYQAAFSFIDNNSSEYTDDTINDAPIISSTSSFTWGDSESIVCLGVFILYSSSGSSLTNLLLLSIGTSSVSMGNITGLTFTGINGNSMPTYSETGRTSVYDKIVPISANFGVVATRT